MGDQLDAKLFAWIVSVVVCYDNSSITSFGFCRCPLIPHIMFKGQPTIDDGPINYCN